MWFHFYMERHPLRRSALAAEVRAELARQKKTYASLAQATNISVDTLRRRLDGIKPFHVEELDSITNYLGITLTELIERSSQRGTNV